jgi:hypothetical protein
MGYESILLPASGTECTKQRTPSTTTQRERMSTVIAMPKTSAAPMTQICACLLSQTRNHGLKAAELQIMLVSLNNCKQLT